MLSTIQRHKAGFVLAFVLGAVGCLYAAAVTPPAPPVVGANGEAVSGVTIDWKTLLGMLGGGSGVLAFITGWLKDNGGKVIDVLKPVLPVPIPDPKIVIDSAELVQAVIAYNANKNDKNAKRRFLIAVTTEAADVIDMKSPVIATAFNQLVVAVVNDWVPAAPPEAVK